jgi:hypothetical protein
VSDLHLASCLISAPAFIACAQGGNNCGQVRYPADPPNGAPVVGNGREVLALVELGPVTLEALPDGVVDGAGQGGAGLAVVCRNSTAARARSATLPQIVTTTRRLGPGGRARPGLGRVWACLVGDEGVGEPGGGGAGTAAGDDKAPGSAVGRAGARGRQSGRGSPAGHDAGGVRQRGGCVQPLGNRGNVAVGQAMAARTAGLLQLRQDHQQRARPPQRSSASSASPHPGGTPRT